MALLAVVIPVVRPFRPPLKGLTGGSNTSSKAFFRPLPGTPLQKWPKKALLLVLPPQQRPFWGMPQGPLSEIAASAKSYLANPRLCGPARVFKGGAALLGGARRGRIKASVASGMRSRRAARAGIPQGGNAPSLWWGIPKGAGPLWGERGT